MATTVYEGVYNKLFPNKLSTNSFLTFYILKVLHEKRAKMYGKEIIDEIDSRFSNSFKASHGLTYPILRNLESEGLVSAEWEGNDPSKRTKRYYKITEDGILALHKETQAFKPMVYDSYMFIANVMKDIESVAQ